MLENIKDLEYFAEKYNLGKGETKTTYYIKGRHKYVMIDKDKITLIDYSNGGWKEKTICKGYNEVRIWSFLDETEPILLVWITKNKGEEMVLMSDKAIVAHGMGRDNT